MFQSSKCQPFETPIATVKKSMSPEEVESFNKVDKSSINQAFSGDTLEISDSEGQRKPITVQSLLSTSQNGKLMGIQSPSVITGSANDRDMSQFVEILETSNRLKRKGHLTGTVSPFYSSFSVKKPNISKVRKREMGATEKGSEPNQLVMEVISVPNEESLGLDGDVDALEKDLGDSTTTCKNSNMAITNTEMIEPVTVSDTRPSKFIDFSFKYDNDSSFSKRQVDQDPETNHLITHVSFSKAWTKEIINKKDKILLKY